MGPDQFYVRWTRPAHRDLQIIIDENCRSSAVQSTAICEKVAGSGLFSDLESGSLFPHKRRLRMPASDRQKVSHNLRDRRVRENRLDHANFVPLSDIQISSLVFHYSNNPSLLCLITLVIHHSPSIQFVHRSGARLELTN